jgi:hypothetical protein
MFLSFSVVIVFIDRTNQLLRRWLSRCEIENQGGAYLFSYAAIKILCKDFLAGLAFLGGSKRKFYRSSKPPSVAQDIPSLITNENKHTNACKYKKMGFSKKELNKDIQSVSTSFSFGPPANNTDIPELS